MSRRSNAAAEAAAAQASEAARVLQQRGQQARSESRLEPAPEPQPEVETQRPNATKEQKPELTESRIEQLRKNNPRNKIMEELEQRDLERRGIKAEPEPAPAEELKSQEPEKPQEPAQPEAPAQEAPASEPEAPKMTKQVVDGEEYEVSEAELAESGGARAWRIAKAAENRLKKANEVLAEAQKSKVDIGQLVQAIRQPPAPVKPQESDAEFIAARIDTMRFGTPEQAAQAQLEIQQRLTPRIDPNAIILQTTANIKYDAAQAQFKSEFQDIAANPLLMKLAKTLEGERLAPYVKNGQIDWPSLSTVDWQSFMRTIGTEVRNAAGRPSQPATAPAATNGTPSQPSSEKEARKASIVNLPAAAARAEPPKEEKPETRQDILNEMRKKRGLPVG